MIDQIMEVARKAARASAAQIMAALDRPREYSQKGLTNLVTETDRLAESIIISMIRDAYPTHSILAEESGKSDGESDYLWVIDPLDGTTNFVHGYPSFAVSIGVVYKSRPIAGVILALPGWNLYWAAEGKGAFCDDRQIQVSPTSSIEKSLLVTGFGYEHGPVWEKNMELFKLFTDRVQGVRRLGAAAVDLCHVACGYVDGYWEFDLHPWDSAAGIVLVQEAGGRVTGMDGKPYSIYQNHLLASNGCLHPDLLAVISPVIKNVL